MDRNQALSALRQAAQRSAPIPDDAWDELAPSLVLRSFGRGETIVAEGQPVRDFYFVLEGLIRFFYVTDKGKEFNKAFFVEGEFAGVFSAGLDEPCPFNIEALEPTAVVSMPRAAMQAVAARHRAAEHVDRVQAERIARAGSKRTRELLVESAEERYRQFCAERPDLCARLSQRHIASFIGVTDVALSRIAKRVRDSG